MASGPDHILDREEPGLAARMTAGSCWRWSDPRPDGRLVDVVTIGGWSRPWNLRSDGGVGGAPPSSLWASDPGGFGQVGCVYTAQGFEHHWNGVIVEPDLVWRTDRWVARPEYSHDNDVRRSDLGEFDRAIRNTYKVLLTRGLRGMEVYSTDAETQKLLESLVP